MNKSTLKKVNLSNFFEMNDAAANGRGIKYSYWIPDQVRDDTTPQADGVLNPNILSRADF